MHICEIVRRLPAIVASMLDQEKNMSRGKFREETFTDLLVASLLLNAGPNLIICYPNEQKTGSDIDIVFRNIEKNETFQIRIQAKRLSSGRGLPNSCRSYDHLLHYVKKTSEYQFRTLIKESVGYIPLYMFYNHKEVVDDEIFQDDNLPEVRGINLAFAFDIAREMENLIQKKGRGKKNPHRRLSHLQKYLFNIEDIFCPPGDWDDEEVPPPACVANSIERIFERSINQSAEGMGPQQIDRYKAYNEAQKGIEVEIKPIHDGPSIRFSPDVKRITLFFLTGRTDDERTPKITE
ncbi:hypothetical protein PJ900_17955 [Tistrella mobilis]|uniref:DUF6615 family protein n=1 Tax=Tistrella mobilis TaxID=171437 RepID=UPI0026D08906|nr:DUF6615 family protein [Tistrella mobilis]